MDLALYECFFFVMNVSNFTLSILVIESITFLFVSSNRKELLYYYYLLLHKIHDINIHFAIHDAFASFQLNGKLEFLRAELHVMQ